MTQTFCRFFLSLLIITSAFGSLNAQNLNADSLKKVIRTSDIDTVRIKAQLALASVVINSNLDSALQLSSVAYNKSKAISYQLGVMRSANMLGNYYQRKAEYDKAIAFYNESKKIAASTNDFEGLAGADNNLGIIYINKADFPAALTAFLEALNYEKKRGNNQGVAECYVNIGAVHFYQGDLKKCEEYWNKSVSISEAAGDLKNAKKSYVNLGAVMQMAKKYDEALRYMGRALAISESQSDKLDISICTENMANVYVLKGDREQAKKLYDRTVEIKKELGDYNGLAIVYVSIGAFFEGVKDLFTAEKYYQEALKISREKGLRDQELKSLKSLSQLYKAQKDYTRSLDFLEQASIVGDSIYSIEKAKSIQELQTKFETVEKEKELAQEKANVANSKLVIKNRNNTIILVCAGFVICLIVAGGWYNRNQYRQRQYRKEVELKQLLADAELKNKIQGERERISRDLHDHIGSQLTLIISGLDTMSFHESKKNHDAEADQLNDLSDQARLTMGQLRETIWAMNKEEVSMEMLVSKIREFTNKAHRSINTEIDGDGKVVISPAKSLALFRVCQEAINNAIKHAEFQTMNISFSAENDKINVMIKDDGKGFDMQEVAKTGYGLENMAFRLQECGGSFKLDSTPGTGTTILMQISLN